MRDPNVTPWFQLTQVSEYSECHITLQSPSIDNHFINTITRLFMFDSFHKTSFISLKYSFVI